MNDVCRVRAPGIQEQIRVLMSIKEALIKLDTSAADISLLVDRSACVLKFLRDEDVVMPVVEEQLELGRQALEKITREAPQIAAKISPMMRGHSTKIRADIHGYETHLVSYRDQLLKAEFFLYRTGSVKALELLDQADLVQLKQKVVCDQMAHIANVFECVSDMDGAKKIIVEVGELLRDFRLLWQTQMKVGEVLDDAKTIVWEKLDPESFEDSGKGLVVLLRRLPKTVKGADAFKGLDKTVKEFVITCPIIVTLRSPAMRERHWRELMDVVKKEFKLPSKNPKMVLRELLELELHVHANDVEEICEKANKEAKHEDTLKNLETTWSAVNFLMTFYKDTDVPLLRLEDAAVEQLESDQMAVQSIIGSRYGHFKPPAAEWQHSLGLISDITQILMDLQRTWSYLEPLFIGSDEVKRELPEDARRFQEIDGVVRSILQKAWKARNVKVTCQQPGLLDKLRDLEQKQDQCKKSLSEFLDGKRRYGC
jgi:dynein heavy chain, axonemal